MFKCIKNKPIWAWHLHALYFGLDEAAGREEVNLWEWSSPEIIKTFISANMVASRPGFF